MVENRARMVSKDPGLVYTGHELHSKTTAFINHDDVIKWKHFLRYRPSRRLRRYCNAHYEQHFTNT